MIMRAARPRFAQDNKAAVLEHPPATPPVLAPSWLRPAVIERLVMVADALIVFMSGIGCALAYHLAATGASGKLDVYAAASALTATNFTLLITVQHGYRIKQI